MALIVSACDTGSANAFAPVLAGSRVPCVVFAEGAAARVFDRWTIRYEPVEPCAWTDLQGLGDAVLSRVAADAVVVGTSWGPGIDKALTLAARGRGIPCASFVEHWDWYVERFSVVVDGRVADRGVFIPDRVWVPDATAAAEASAAGLPAGVIEEVGQPHLESQLRRLRAAGAPRGGDVVFVSERIGADCGIGSPLYRGFDEFAVVDRLIETIDAQASRLVIKLHPQEDEHKFAAVIADRRNVRAVKEADNVELIATARTIVGMISMLLLEAALVRSDVISFLPGCSASMFVGNRIGATTPATTREELARLLDASARGGTGAAPSTFGDRFIGSAARMAGAMERLAVGALRV